MEPDFSGWATKAGLKCSDGRTITPQAFQHMDGMTVPLVWKHDHNNPDNILGHVLLEAKPEGVRCHGFFNDTPSGINAKALVAHKDVNSLSIWANQIKEHAKQVLHGMIREVSIVLSGANPGAKIDYVRIVHGDGPDEYTESEDEFILHGMELAIEEPDSLEGEVEEIAHAAQTVEDVFNTLNEEQKAAVYFMLGAATEGMTPPVAQTEDKTEDDLEHKKEGTDDVTSTRNVFEQSGKTTTPDGDKHVLSHDDVLSIGKRAAQLGSLKMAVNEYVVSHGIENIDILFPDAKNVTGAPEFDKRRTEWVDGVLNGATHRPFARIKTMSANLTLDEARAKGYVKGNFKKEEFFAVTKRSTSPVTIYKKQKLDRDDIIDITEFDVVAWLKAEIRLMLNEEIARAILIGDGRAVDDEDKIKDPVGAQDGTGIRSIAFDHELYAATAYVNISDANSDYYEVIEQVLRQRKLYKGTGTPDFYTTEPVITEMLLSKDALGRRRFSNLSELAAELRVNSIVAVEAMEADYAADILGIMVNLVDYSTGTDRGGEVNFFDDFDIDYNQFKYMMEGRMSGGLTKIRSAVVFRKTAGTDVLVNPITAPTFVAATGVITIPTQTGVTYHYVNTDGTSGSTLSAGAQTAITAGTSKTVRAVPATNYYFLNNIDDEWTFTRPVA
jgi:hypothetical protein